MSDGGLSTRTKAAIVLAAQATSAFVAYGSLLVAGHFFAPESFGMHSFAIGTTALMALLTDLGVGLAHQRAVAQGADRGRALTALVVLRAALLLALVAVVIAAWSIASDWAVRQLQDTVTRTVLAWAIAFQVLTLIRATIEATWLGEQRPHLVEAVRLVDSIVTLTVLVNAGLLVAFLAGLHAPLVGVGGVWARILHLGHPLDIEQGALLILGSYTVGRLAGLLLAAAWALRDGLRFGPWDRSMARQFLRVAFPLSIAYFMSVVLTSTDVVALGVFGDARDVAYYAAAQRLAMIGLLVTVAVGTVLFPRFAQLHAAAEHDSLEATSIHAHRYLLLIVSPIAAAMLALPAQGLVAAVGPNYLPSVAPLRWLATWIVLMAIMNPLTMRLMGEGRDRLVVVGTVVNAGLNVILDLVFVPRWGAAGAAAATTASTLGALVVLVALAKPRSVRDVLQHHAPGVFLAAAATGIVWWTIGHLLPGAWLDHTLDLLLVGVAGLALYALLLRLVGGLHQEDLDALRALLRPRQWLTQHDEGPR